MPSDTKRKQKLYFTWNRQINLCKDMSHDNTNRIGGVIVRLLVLNAVHRGFYIWSGQVKDYKIGICCFSAKHAALSRERKDWLAQNQVIVVVIVW